MAKVRRYTIEQVEAARKKLRSLPVKEAGKTRTEVATFLESDIKQAVRRGYTLRDIRDLLAEVGVTVPLTRLKALFEKAPDLESIGAGEGCREVIFPSTSPPSGGDKTGEDESTNRV